MKKYLIYFHEVGKTYTNDECSKAAYEVESVEIALSRLYSVMKVQNTQIFIRNIVVQSMEIKTTQL